MAAILACCACGTGASEKPDRAAEFLELARAEIERGGDGSETMAFVAAQEPQVQVEIASSAAARPEPVFQTLAARIYLANDRFDRAVPILAEQIIAGEELSALGFQLVHGDDTRALRVFLELGRTLFARRTELTAEEALRVNRFLCRLAQSDDPSCPAEQIEQGLTAIEELLEAQEKP